MHWVQFHMASGRQHKPPHTWVESLIRTAAHSPLLILACLLFVPGCRKKSAPSPQDHVQLDNELQLDNGLQLSLIPRPGTEQTCLLILYEFGQRSDPDDESGLAHVLEHLYVTAATEKQPRRTALEFADAYPLGWNAQVGDDYTVIATVFEPGSLAAEIEMAADRMVNLKIEAADLKREHPRIETELKSMYWSPPTLAILNHGRHLAAPLPGKGRRGGRMEDIKALSADDLQNRADRYYKPINAHLVLAGDFEAEEARKLVRASFATIPAGEKIPDAPAMQAPAPGTHQVEFPKGVHVGYTYRAPEPDHALYPAFLLLGLHLQMASFQGLGHPIADLRCTYLVLDDPRSFHIRADLQEGDEDEAAAKALRARFTSQLEKTRSPQQIAQARFAASNILGLDSKTTNRRTNPYSTAFAHARLQQMGWERSDLAERLAEVDSAEIQKAIETIFVPENEVQVMGNGSKNGK